jgi:hypothetical protein
MLPTIAIPRACCLCFVFVPVFVPVFLPVLVLVFVFEPLAERLMRLVLEEFASAVKLAE